MWYYLQRSLRKLSAAIPNSGRTFLAFTCSGALKAWWIRKQYQQSSTRHIWGKIAQFLTLSYTCHVISVFLPSFEPGSSNIAYLTVHVSLAMYGKHSISSLPLATFLSSWASSLRILGRVWYYSIKLCTMNWCTWHPRHFDSTGVKKLTASS